MHIALPRFGDAARSIILSSLLLGVTLSTRAQETTVTPLSRQLARLDFAVSGTGEFTKSTAGPDTAAGSSNFGNSLSLNPSNTLGALVTLRYTRSNYVGFEGNYGYARYSEGFSNITGASPPNFRIQTNASEYTLGYVAHIPHPFFNLQPFVAVGAGSMGFKPTPNGGLGLNTQARAAYYYAAGVETPLGTHFGARAQFRQVFFLAPDFGQNYLTNLQHTYTVEPSFGFYLHY